MAYAKTPLTFASAVVAVPGTSVAPSSPVPDNCQGFVILNSSSTNGLLMGLGVAGTTVLTAGTNATLIPAGQSMTFPIGDIGLRGIMDQSQLASSGLIFDASGGAATGYVTYMNVLGG